MEDDLEQPAEQLDSEAAGNTAAEDDTTAAGQQDDDQSDAASQEQTEEDEEEIEVGDRKFSLPKSAAEKLKTERMLNADYTQKTQTLAEDRKGLAAEREQHERHQVEAQQYIGELAKVQSIDARIAEYKALDWDALSDNDPITFQKLDRQMRVLEGSRAEAVQAITQKQNSNALAEQQSLAKQVQEADAYFKREIPGWSAERSTRVQKYAIEQGISADALFQAVVRNPALAKVLHKAELFDQLEKKQSAAKPKPVIQEKPVTRITAARGSAQRDPEKMNMDEWAKWRNAERSKKR
jgi:hypothetical protein